MTVAGEVAGLVSDLIRIDTTNTGDPATLAGERAAAEYLAEKLAEVGYEPDYVESGAAGRGNVVVRLPGADPGRGVLLVHGHLDVVPGRGVRLGRAPVLRGDSAGVRLGPRRDRMKHMVGMSLAVARQLRRDGAVPLRDVVFAFFADEEAGGFQGARRFVEHRRDLFDGVTEAISEVGGFSLTVRDGVRAYLVETAEKGSVWLRLKVRGAAGHGSMLHADNAVARLAAAVARLDAHQFPLVLTGPVREFLEGFGALTGVPFDGRDPEAALGRLGTFARMIGASLRDTANVTMFTAGYAPNVVPSPYRGGAGRRLRRGRHDGGVRTGRAGAATGALRGLRDVVVLTRRNLLHIVRMPGVLLVLSVMPVVFVLMLTAVFGGAVGAVLPPAAAGRYANWLVRAHNPEVAGSNPVPATTKVQVRTRFPNSGAAFLISFRALSGQTR
jgi:acetylornithine deacetylase/succinyl-diaminopimelate desuccinylase-like protein